MTTVHPGRSLQQKKPGQSMPRQSMPRKSASTTAAKAKPRSHQNQPATGKNDRVIQPLVFLKVDQGRWADLERLFEGRGGPHNCWCMVWRATPEEARHTEGKRRKAALKKRVEGDVPIGILGYFELVLFNMMKYP